ncbi:tetraspanin-18-like [Ruditapes philippinarum]|uniref:tetraspanin-18-like n=1 Tax=Ruditapes philippinarum TaxID=129788 RepID=UPI00295B316E|nr:tetraspanin-18-like [Ruditapes philippinarum]
MKPVVKFALVINSLIVTVLGAGLTFVGVVVKFYTELIDGYLTPIIKLLSAGGGTGADVWKLYSMTAIALITFGIAVVISGFIGCYVAASPKRKVVIAYMIFTTVMIVMQLTSAALIFTMKVEDDIKDTLKINLVTSYFGDEAKDEYSAAWNYAMVEFSCCGAEAAGDFKLTLNWDREKTGDNGTYIVTVPVTCCKLPGKYPDFGKPYDENCTVKPSSGNSYYQQNCYEKFEEYLQYYEILMSCSSLATVVFQCLTLTILVVISVEMKRKRNKIKQALEEEVVPME